MIAKRENRRTGEQGRQEKKREEGRGKREEGRDEERKREKRTVEFRPGVVQLV